MNNEKRNRIGAHTGVQWRKELIASLEKKESFAFDPRDKHEKMMSEARKKVLLRMRELDTVGDIVQEAVRTDIRAVARRYPQSVMNDGYINVYGQKAVCLL